MLPSIVECLERSNKHELFLTAMRRSGVADALSQGGPYTVFGPSDEAIRTLPKSTQQLLTDDSKKEELAQWVRSHVVRGSYTLSDIKVQKSVTSLANTRLNVLNKSDGVWVDRVQLTGGELRAANGLVHPIDNTFATSDKTALAAMKEAGFTTMAKLCEQSTSAKLVSGDWPLTVLAVDETYFAKLPAGTLQRLLDPSNRSALDAFVDRHLVLGRVSTQDLSTTKLKAVDQHGFKVLAVERGPTIDGVAITKPDLSCRNGVIHGIASGLVPGAVP